ncbi:MAG TPA: hypothetical protein VMN78_04085 [Longimicrobiales bacterium]|nr:hypothetical protein [Longimicrobiales bacterium]
MSSVQRWPAVLLWAALPLLHAGSLDAQRVDSFERRLQRPPLHSVEQSDPSVAGAFLASAVVPGAGQYRLGAGRWVAYIGVEAWAWINWVDTRTEANELGTEYRDLAWSVARRISVGDRADREFEYYEAMSNFLESGSFDADPGAPGLQPEEDGATFNGSVWALARAIFFPAGADSLPPSDQEQAAALDYYERNAIEPGYAWSWGSNRLEQEHFRTLIRRSDEAARASTTLLGVVLVNHVVSAIDAWITARLRANGREPPLRLRNETRNGASGPASFLVIEVPVP